MGRAGGRGSSRVGAGEGDVALNPGGEIPGSPIGGDLRRELMEKVPPGGEPGVARVRVDEDVLMHLASALGPRKHTRFFFAQTIISATGLAVLLAIAIGGIIKLDEMNQNIAKIASIQTDIAKMAEGVTKMSQNLDQLTNISSQLGNAFGAGAASTLSGLIGNGVDALGNALGGSSRSNGDSSSSDVPDPLGGCDPSSANFTACLLDPPDGSVALPLDDGSDGGNSSIWRNLVGGLVGGLRNIGSDLISNIGDDGDGGQ